MESCKIEKQALALHHPGEEFTFINFEIQAILSLTDQVALTTVKIINVENLLSYLPNSYLSNG